MFEELEYKYRAEHITLESFKDLMATLGPSSFKLASSWDIYYLSMGNLNKSKRLRLGERPELTTKEKTTDNNNWARIEIDIPLDPSIPEIELEKIVTESVSLDAYKENFRVFKVCYIYKFENINYVYYVVLDHDLKESARFVELELNKDKVENLRSLGKVESTLKYGEEILSTLGISPKNRLKKSIFEMYRKEV